MTRTKNNHCVDCQKEIWEGSVRCKSCAKKHSWAISVGYDEQTNTKICNRCHERKQMGDFHKNRGTHRPTCKECIKKEYYNECIDCGTMISSSATRCKPCFTKVFGESVSAAWENGNYENVKRIEKHTRNAIKKMSRARKRAWRNGLYDNSFSTKEYSDKVRKRLLKEWRTGKRKAIPPGKVSKLEKRIAKILSELNIEYETQFKIGDDRRKYDFYLPHYNTLLEIDGDYWHSIPGAKERDRKKTALGIRHGFNVERITEKTLTEDGERETIISFIETLSMPG